MSELTLCDLFLGKTDLMIKSFMQLQKLWFNRLSAVVEAAPAPAAEKKEKAKPAPEKAKPAPKKEAAPAPSKPHAAPKEEIPPAEKYTVASDFARGVLPIWPQKTRALTL